MQKKLKTWKREEVEGTNQLILPFFKSEKTLAFSDDESMLLTDTSCSDPNNLILPSTEKAGDYHIIRKLKKYGGNAIQVLVQHYLTHPAKDTGLYSKLISGPGEGWDEGEEVG